MFGAALNRPGICHCLRRVSAGFAGLPWSIVGSWGSHDLRTASPNYDGRRRFATAGT